MTREDVTETAAYVGLALAVLGVVLAYQWGKRSSPPPSAPKGAPPP